MSVVGARITTCAETASMPRRRTGFTVIRRLSLLLCEIVEPVRGCSSTHRKGVVSNLLTDYGVERLHSLRVGSTAGLR